jgi:DNA-binding transcriptional ArsR family regulator
MIIDMENAGLAAMEAKAEEAARMLSTLANAKRLMALCHLLGGEKSVGQLAALVGLAPAALSQHLARMRDLRLVETRRDGQTIHYSLASPEVGAILATLHGLYCQPTTAAAGAAAGGADAMPAGR